MLVKRLRPPIDSKVFARMTILLHIGRRVEGAAHSHGLECKVSGMKPDADHVSARFKLGQLLPTDRDCSLHNSWSTHSNPQSKEIAVQASRFGHISNRYAQVRRLHDIRRCSKWACEQCKSVGIGTVSVGRLHASISPICKEMEDLHIANGIDSSIL